MNEITHIPGPTRAANEQAPRTLPIHLLDYAEAVRRLYLTARHTTSGGRAAAQVLLSAYNGYEFHLDVVDLCLMDEQNLADALTVMQGRAMLGREPHNLLKNGGKLFEALAEQWSGLHVSQRYKEAQA
ncbi:MAG: hypothetical protein JJU06_13335 [Ectothiorhodospiraceae bacterium]|nr:hypothetical protein [Ectothiorhodospiraceae bacterium]